MRFLLLSIFLLISAIAMSQVADNLSLTDGRKLVKGKVEGNDTIPHVDIREIVIMPERQFKSNRDYMRYSRLVRNVKITLPYARVAAHKLADINRHMATLKTDKERRAYLKKAEKDLFAEFEKPLRKLTVSQGKLLIKLIDRETGSTTFDLIKQYKGGVPAFFWQSVARIFGSNLKDEFDEEGDDRTINYIINLIDNGIL